MLKSLAPLFRAATSKVFHTILTGASKSAFEVDLILFRYAKGVLLMAAAVLVGSRLFGSWPFLDHLFQQSLYVGFLVAKSCVVSLLILGAGVFLLRAFVRRTYPELDAIRSDEELIAFFKPLNKRQEGYIRAIAKRERTRLA